MKHDKNELEQRIHFSVEEMKKLIELHKQFSAERDVIGEISKFKKDENEGYLG